MWVHQLLTRSRFIVLVECIAMEVSSNRSTVWVSQNIKLNQISKSKFNGTIVEFEPDIAIFKEIKV